MPIVNVFHQPRKLEDNEVIIHIAVSEIRTAFDFLSDKLKGRVRQTVVLDTNNYRGFWSSLMNKHEYRYVLTWNEALRLQSYLRYWLEKGRDRDISVSLASIRNFAVYGVNVKCPKNLTKKSLRQKLDDFLL